ncbi:MAG: hypothetical protein NC318_07145 [Blautia sp.]|nr:hypothetical protein [Muribaculaceae bacterium]MCM1211362.1 hypothetical protein [Blautia sp.]
MTEEQMRMRAAEGYFVRDLEKNLVYCPTGVVLRKKSVRKNGDTRYANKMECKVCPVKDDCTRSPWKEVDFPDQVQEARNLNWLRARENAGNA